MRNQTLGDARRNVTIPSPATMRKPAKSLFYSVPFDTGGDSDEDAFRRALAVGYTTATPNFVVVGIDREHRRLVFHQIEDSEVPEMTKQLGARA